MIVRAVIFIYLIRFSSGFFKSDLYYTKVSGGNSSACDRDSSASFCRTSCTNLIAHRVSPVQPNYLLGAFGLLAFYLLSNSYIWNTKSYGQHVAYLIIVFYMTPLRTFQVLIMTTVHCSIYIVILAVLQFLEGTQDPKCMNNGYQYVCRPNPKKEKGENFMTNSQESKY